LAWKHPKRSPGYEHPDKSALAKSIKADLKRLGMTQKDLADRSGLPQSRISRILRGGNVRLTEQDINQLAFGLMKTAKERDEMRYLAWPELRYIDEALNKRESIVTLNCQLAEKGLPLLGNDFQE